MSGDTLAWVLLWVAFTGLGLAASLWNRADAKRDLEELPGEVQNGRRTYGEGWVRLETIRSLVQGIGLALGLGPLLGVELPVVQGLVAMAGLISLNTVLDYRQRKRMNKTLKVGKS